MTLTVGSLFSGIGGIDLGLERAGMVVRWQSEIDPYCSQILSKHWPTVPNLGDIKTIDWRDVEPVDVIAGGYPCQPFSLAGQRKGTNDERHLWPHFFDAIRVLRPRFAFLENVAAHLHLGFGSVCADLASIGYDTQWDCIPAAAVGAPHRRDRLFVVAYTDRDRVRNESVTKLWRDGASITAVDGETQHMADTDEVRRDGRTRQSSDDTRWPKPTHSSWWATEPDVGRVAHGIPDRMDRISALGNAVVPQVAEHVGRIIIAKEHAA